MLTASTCQNSVRSEGWENNDIEIQKEQKSIFVNTSPMGLKINRKDVVLLGINSIVWILNQFMV